MIGQGQWIPPRAGFCAQIRLIRVVPHFLAFAMLVLPAAQAEVEEAGNYEAPSRIVDGLHESLIHVMQRASELGFPGRYAELEPIIRAGFDTPLIVKVILSRYWNEITDLQKEEFIELFTRLSIATYASRFDGFQGEQFVQTSVEPLKKGRLLIRTELQRPNDGPVHLHYLMHQNDTGQWRIISVIADGVNDLSLKRAEYAAVIKNRGYAGLVSDIEVKIRDMGKGSDEPANIVQGN